MKIPAFSILLLCLLFSFFSYSQSDQPLYFKGIKIIEATGGYNKGDSLYRVNKVASQVVEYTEIKKGKGKQKQTYIYAYDDQGRRILSQKTTPKNNSNWCYRYKYDSLGRNVETTVKYGKNTSRSVYEFGAYNEAVRINYFKGKDSSTLKLRKNIVNSFNTDSNKTTSITYNSKQHIHAVVTFDYDMQQKLGEAKYYNNKGKLKHSWNFDCSKQGVATTKKNALNICKNSVRLENGHRQEITVEETKFNIKRNIIEFDETGKFVKSEEFTGKDGTILNYSNEIKTIGDTTLQVLQFYTGDERKYYLRNTAEYKYVKHKTVVAHYSWYYKKNKLSSSSNSTFSYSASGLLETEYRNDTIMKTSSKVNYKYTFKK